MHPNATLPVGVVVPAGATSATVTISTTPVSTSQVGTVTAAYGGVAKNVNLTVRPIGVASVSLTPNPVIGPATVTGTVTLECAAAPAAISVALASNQPAIASAAVASIAIPAGASTGKRSANRLLTYCHRRWRSRLARDSDDYRNVIGGRNSGRHDSVDLV